MILAPEFARAFEGKVRRKRNITGNLRYQSVREKTRRICSYSTEVMVRITSYGKDTGNGRRNLGYISRVDVKDKQNLNLETERGELLSGRESIAAYAQAWEQDFGKPSKNRRDTVRMILSMPEGTDPGAVRNATRDFARKTFAANHEYVFVLHTDEPHPHCHLTVKLLGHDGKKLDPRKNDLADWREAFAEALREQGVDAEATWRAARGVVLKPDRPVVHQIKKSGRVSQTEVMAELDAISILKAEQRGVPVAAGPWEAKIAAEQEAVRSAWLAIADQLGRDPVKPVFLPEGHLPRVRRAQQAGADFQATLAAPDPGESPRPVKRLGALPAVLHRPAASPGRLAGVGRLADIRSIHPSPPPVFNQETDHARTRSAQQHSAVYQSHLAATQKGPPRAVASLRELPRLDVVRQRSGSQVLLQPDARHHLGAGAGADTGVRWEGTGGDGDPGSAGRKGGAQRRPQAGVEGGREGTPAGAGGGSGHHGTRSRPGTLAGLKKLSDLPDSRADDKALAGQIRAFVAAMPAVETQRDLLKRRLAAQFPAQVQPLQPVPAENAGQEKGAEQAASVGKDIAP